jgi:hypothetical protein
MFSFLVTLLNQLRRIKPGALSTETPTASSPMEALQTSSVLWNGSSCYKQELLPFKKQTKNGTAKAIEMNLKFFWSRPLEQQGWTTAQQKKSFKHCLSNQVGLQVQCWGKWCIK